MATVFICKMSSLTVASTILLVMVAAHVSSAVGGDHSHGATSETGPVPTQGLMMPGYWSPAAEDNAVVGANSSLQWVQEHVRDDQIISCTEQTSESIIHVIIISDPPSVLNLHAIPS